MIADQEKIERLLADAQEAIDTDRLPIATLQMLAALAMAVRGINSLVGKHNRLLEEIEDRLQLVEERRP